MGGRVRDQKMKEDGKGMEKEWNQALKGMMYY